MGALSTARSAGCSTRELSTSARSATPLPVAPMLAAIALALGALPDLNITLDRATFHVNDVLTTDSCLRIRDVHRFTGHIGANGVGKMRVHVDNGTIPSDYTIAFEPRNPPPRPYMLDLKASWTCNGTQIVVRGSALIEYAPRGPPTGELYEMSLRRVVGGKQLILGSLLYGPNPPPPPPPPPKCSDAHNQTACDACPYSNGTKGACAWCVSDDGVHELCFARAAKPDTSDWRCDR